MLRAKIYDTRKQPQFKELRLILSGMEGTDVVYGYLSQLFHVASATAARESEFTDSFTPVCHSAGNKCEA